MDADRHIIFQDAAAKRLIRLVLSPPSETRHRGILTHARKSYSLPSLKPDPTFDL